MAQFVKLLLSEAMPISNVHCIFYAVYIGIAAIHCQLGKRWKCQFKCTLLPTYLNKWSSHNSVFPMQRGVFPTQRGGKDSFPAKHPRTRVVGSRNSPISAPFPPNPLTIRCSHRQQRLVYGGCGPFTNPRVASKRVGVARGARAFKQTLHPNATHVRDKSCKL